MLLTGDDAAVNRQHRGGPVSPTDPSLAQGWATGEGGQVSCPAQGPLQRFPRLLDAVPTVRCVCVLEEQMSDARLKPYEDCARHSLVCITSKPK